jgi:hypothetical protein
MKVKLLKKLRKTHYIKYDKMSKQYFVYYAVGKWETEIKTGNVDIAFNWYRVNIIEAAYSIVCREPRTKFIDVNHAVKPKI